MLGVGILFKARQLRAHHGPCLEGDGEPLKETLTAIAHPYGGAPPLSPAEALPPLTDLRHPRKGRAVPAFGKICDGL